MLHELLEVLANEYAHERAKPYAKSKFANFVRHDVAIAAKKTLLFLPYELKVKASVGAGNWAAVPWLGIFDPLITESATKGFYIVYLINAQNRDIYLSLNQGTTAAYQSLGETRGREYLRRTAVEIAERVSKFSKRFETEQIDLGSQESLPLGYAAGHSFGRKYAAGNIDADLFYNDLNEILAAYEELINLGGTTPSDTLMEEAQSSDIVESRNYALSRRIERSPNVRNKVLTCKGAICEGCGLDPVLHYNFSGPTKNIPLDVHHSKPLYGLAEGETRRYNLPDDFLVLCPTCHRVIHKQNNPADLEQLRNQVMFKHFRKTVF